jgi:hypothetical protein
MFLKELLFGAAAEQCSHDLAAKKKNKQLLVSQDIIRQQQQHQQQHSGFEKGRRVHCPCRQSRQTALLRAFFWPKFHFCQ